MRGLGQSNLTHDFNAYNADNEIWDAVAGAFEAKVAADFADYRIAATKISDVNDPSVDEWFTATAPAGTVRYELVERGATLATSHVVWEDGVAASTETRATVSDTSSELVETVTRTL